MILPTAYFAPAEWYRAFYSEPALIEVCESFPKQTFRNRCQILSPNGIITLSVPVCRVEHKQLTRDIQISYQQHWQHQHQVALISAYKRTPYFNYYQDYIMPLFEHKYKYLKDLNDHCHHVVDSLINNIPPVPFSSPVYSASSSASFSPLPVTSAWQQTDLEQHWGNGHSILDLLMEHGPMTKEMIQ